MGKFMRRISERFKEKTGGGKNVVSNHRNTAMLRELASHSAQLKAFEKDFRALKAAAEAALKTARDSLASPLPRLYETHEATLATGKLSLLAGAVGGGGVKVEEVLALSIDAGKRLGDEVFTPLGRWQSSYTYVVQSNKELENLRLEVDSRKRTVDDLEAKVDALRSKLAGREAGSHKAQEQMEAAALKLQHKMGKLTVAQERFLQQEEELHARLASLVHDAIWLRNFACAALCIEGDLLCAAGQAVGLIDPAAVPPTLHPTAAAAAAGGSRAALPETAQGATVSEVFDVDVAGSLHPAFAAGAVPRRRALPELEAPPAAWEGQGGREPLRLEEGPSRAQGLPTQAPGAGAAVLAAGPGSARSARAPPPAGPVVTYRGLGTAAAAAGAGAAAGAVTAAGIGPAGVGLRTVAGAGSPAAGAAGGGARASGPNPGAVSSRLSASRGGGAWAPFRTVEELEEEGEQDYSAAWHAQQQRVAQRGGVQQGGAQRPQQQWEGEQWGPAGGVGGARQQQRGGEWEREQWDGGEATQQWAQHQQQQQQRGRGRGQEQWGGAAGVQVPQREQEFWDGPAAAADEWGEYHSRHGTVIIHDISHLPAQPDADISSLPSPPRHAIRPHSPPRHRHHSQRDMLVGGRGGRGVVDKEHEMLEELVRGQQQQGRQAQQAQHAEQAQQLFEPSEPQYDVEDDVAYAGNPFIERATDYACFAPTTPSPNALPAPKALQQEGGGSSAYGGYYAQGAGYCDPIPE